MTKFRKWLIHKLGGITNEDIPYERKIILREENLVQIGVRKEVWGDKDGNLYPSEKVLKKELTHRLVDFLEPEYTLNEGPEVNGNISKQYFMEARMWVPERYVKKEVKKDE